MERFKILNEMRKLCRSHDIVFEIDETGLIIKKYFEFNDKPNRFRLKFSFEMLNYINLKDDEVLEFFVSEFERKLKNSNK